MALNLTQKKKKSFTISATSEERKSSPGWDIVEERAENTLLAPTERPQLILLAGLEWYKVSNILQDVHYFTTETRGQAFRAFLWGRGVGVQSDGKAQFRAREMNYTDVCYKSLT